MSRSLYYLFSYISVLLFIIFSTESPGKSQETTVSSESDVVVVGGGSAGVPAAIQSARLGAKTLLLESNSQIGGNATSGGVNFPGLFHAWGKQVIAGIGWEWVTKTTELSGDPLPDFTVPTGKAHWKHQISVNIPVYTAIGEELCLSSGVELRYYESPIDVQKISETELVEKEQDHSVQNYHWKLTTAAQGELRVVYCKQLIDCTGNGALAALAGAERMRETETQPGTFNYIIKHNIVVNESNKKEIQTLYDNAVKEGKIQPGDTRGGIFSFLNDSSSNYVYGADNSTAESRSQTNIKGRQAALRMLRFIKTLPNGENAKLVSMSQEVGVRETWRVVGEYVITRNDYTSGKKWNDSLAYAFYPVDLHENTTGVQPKHLEEGVVATIPMRALLVQGIPNLLAAGRCISSDRLANSALRVQATCMAAGQAAGAVAGMAALQNVEPKELSIEEIKTTLREHGAIVP